MKPKMIMVGASLILWKLKISGLNLFGFSDSPPDISKYPKKITANEIIKIL